MKLHKLIYYTFLLLAIACGNGSSKSPNAYMEWFSQKDNPLIKVQEMGDYKFTCTVMPPDYFKARNALKGSEEKADDSSIYIKLEIKVLKDPVDPLNYKTASQQESMNRLSYLINGIQGDANLVCGTDTLLTSLHHYERTYHAGNSMVVMFVYEKVFDRKQGLKLVYDDKLFGNGRIVFPFAEAELRKVPSLEL